MVINELNTILGTIKMPFATLTIYKKCVQKFMIFLTFFLDKQP